MAEVVAGVSNTLIDAEPICVKEVDVPKRLVPMRPIAVAPLNNSSLILVSALPELRISPFCDTKTNTLLVADDGVIVAVKVVSAKVSVEFETRVVVLP